MWLNRRNWPRYEYCLQMQHTLVWQICYMLFVIDGKVEDQLGLYLFPKDHWVSIIAWFSLWVTRYKDQQLALPSPRQPKKTFLPERKMLHQPQLVLWLNHQIEIISVTWVCGTPAWGFDRWDRQRLHLQTRAQGNSHPTSHVERHAHTALYRRTECEESNKNICRRKRGRD